MRINSLGKAILGLLLCIAITLMIGKISDRFDSSPEKSERISQETAKTPQKAKTNRIKSKDPSDNSHMRSPIDWRKSSQTIAYPDLNKVANFWIRVSTERERTYLMSGSKKIYTMYSSTGAGNDQATPKGTWHIQAEKGDFFYSQISGEGAKYWLSFKDHGVYLFHSVPTDEKGNFIASEAEQLGKKAASHGCVRLSVPDAKWMYEHVRTGTKVVIS